MTHADPNLKSTITSNKVAIQLLYMEEKCLITEEYKIFVIPKLRNPDESSYFSIASHVQDSVETSQAEVYSHDKGNHGHYCCMALIETFRLCQYARMFNFL